MKTILAILALSLASCSAAAAPTPKHDTQRTVKSIGPSVTFAVAPQGPSTPCNPGKLTLNPSYQPLIVGAFDSTHVQVSACNANYGDSVTVTITASPSVAAVGTGGSCGSNPDGGDFGICGYNPGSGSVYVKDNVTGASITAAFNVQWL